LLSGGVVGAVVAVARPLVVPLLLPPPPQPAARRATIPRRTINARTRRE
jgi:hypothetical protein